MPITVEDKLTNRENLDHEHGQMPLESLCVLLSDGLIELKAQFRGDLDMNIYVGNLAFGVTEDELRGIFGEFGEVDSANIISDKFSGRSKGFGFVEMPDDKEAEEAIRSLDGSDIKGRDVRVNQARPRTERPPRRQEY